MKTSVLSLLLCFFTLGLTSAFAQTGGDAGEAYLRGYTLKNDSEQQEAAGKLDAALAGYRQAHQIISGVAQGFPDWQPEVVKFRLEALQKKIEALQAKTGAAPAPAPVSPVQPNAVVPVMPATVPASDLPASNDPFEIIRRSQAQKDATIQQLREQNKTLQDAYIGAAAARQKAEQDIGTLQKQQTLLQQQIAGAEQAMKATAASAKAESKAQMDATQQELTRLRNEQKMVQDMISGKNTALDDANKALAAAKKDKDTLAAQNTDLVKQNKELTAKVTTLESGSSMKSDDYNKLVIENTRLKQEIDSTRKQVDELKTSATKKDTEIAQLKTNLSSIQTQLVQLRTENTEYQKQVADLTVKLKGMNSTLAKNTATSKSGTRDIKSADENNMLRNIILRQLRQQERQRQAKELVIAEMRQLEKSSKSMMENLEEMTSAKIIITVDEEKLFSEPERNQIYAANAVRATTLMFDSKKAQETPENPAAPVKETATNTASPEEKLLVKAGAAVDKGDFDAAETAFQDALRANPRNASARTSLATLKLRMKKFDEAEVELKKCLVYEPDNDAALYYLGICYYDQSKMEDAAASFEKSLTKKAANAVAHHYLGIIASKGGKRDRAEAEFKQALAIDPAYGDAHFNLAVLYATAEPPNMNLANEHYKNALDRGIKADPAMEKLLKKTDAPKAASQEKAAPAVSAAP